MKPKSLRSRISRKLIRMGLLSPSWFGYRWIEKETVSQYLDRKQNPTLNESYETIHKPEITKNPLPCNIENRNDLPQDRGWWGYSFWDVPERTSGETFTATLPNCKLVPYIDDDKEFWITILNEDERSLELDQISFRPWHAEVLRALGSTDQMEKATWFLERVYRNHSHWLTAHLPKLLLLKSRGELSEVIMPAKSKRTPVINISLEMIGIDPDEFQTFDYTRPLNVDRLTVIETDRFRPELLQSVRSAFPISGTVNPHRRIYISRAKATRRKLQNEDNVWPVLEEMGFEKVFMEDLDFPKQVELMQQSSIVIAPHGAAITNVLFCQTGTHVVEIADLSFPNPNFYALASAMGHHYWILDAEGIGDEHPLEKDLRINPSLVKETVEKIFEY